MSELFGGSFRFFLSVLLACLNHSILLYLV